MLKTLDRFIESVKKNVPGYNSIAVISLAQGMVLASDSKIANFVEHVDGPINSQIYMQALKSIEMVHDDNLGDTLEEIKLTTKNQYYLFTVSPGGNFLAILAVDRQTSNLEEVREVFYKYRESVGKELDDFLD